MAILGAQNTTLREKAREAGGSNHLREARVLYNSDLRSNNTYYFSNNP